MFCNFFLCFHLEEKRFYRSEKPRFRLHGQHDELYNIKMLIVYRFYEQNFRDTLQGDSVGFCVTLPHPRPSRWNNVIILPSERERSFLHRASFHSCENVFTKVETFSPRWKLFLPRWKPRKKLRKLIKTKNVCMSHRSPPFQTSLS